MKPFLLVLSLLAVSCFPVEPTHAQTVVPASPVVCVSVHRYGAYVGHWCEQRVCNAYGCWTNGWWAR